MELISKYLGSGSIYKDYSSSLTIVKYSDITNLIIPFFKKVLGIKQIDFMDWCKAAKLMNDGSHLTL